MCLLPRLLFLPGATAQPLVPDCTGSFNPDPAAAAAEMGCPDQAGHHTVGYDLGTRTGTRAGLCTGATQNPYARPAKNALICLPSMGPVRTAVYLGCLLVCLRLPAIIVWHQRNNIIVLVPASAGGTQSDGVCRCTQVPGVCGDTKSHLVTHKHKVTCHQGHEAAGLGLA